jgi:hypothetical protein
LNAHGVPRLSSGLGPSVLRRGIRLARARFHAVEPIAQFCRSFVLFGSHGVVEFTHDFLNEHLAIDGSAGTTRGLADMMRSTGLGTRHQRPQLVSECFVTLEAADLAGLPKLGKGQSASGTRLRGGFGCRFLGV